MDGTATAIFEKEKQVFSKLKAYSTAYTNYAECNSTDAAGMAAGQTRIGSVACTGAASSLTAATTAATTAISDMEAVLLAYNTGTSPKKTTAVFDASMVELRARYAGITAQRADLDLKLRNLYSAENSISAMNRVELDAAIYANILWTILATSMLYMVFTKL